MILNEIFSNPIAPTTIIQYRKISPKFCKTSTVFRKGIILISTLWNRLGGATILSPKFDINSNITIVSAKKYISIFVSLLYSENST